MNKIFLIIQREYLSRVKKKSFLVMTFLVPLLFVGMMALVAFLTARGGDEVTIVTVIDQSGVFAPEFKNNRSVFFNTTKNTSAEEAKKNSRKAGDFVLLIPGNILQGGKPELSSGKKASLTAIGEIESQMNDILRNRQLENAGIDPQTLKNIKSDISLSTKELTDEGEKDSNAAASYGISFAAAILIYLCLFIYGAQVMRGVIEEKTSRIVEVVISSVKPFQLMMGKILGIGLVGLTQFLLWIVLSTTLTSIAGQKLMGSKVETVKTADSTLHKKELPPAKNEKTEDIMAALGTIPVAYIVTVFLIYFLGGYLLYSALFAAVGSAVDSETETQQFMFPITLPLLFTYIMAFGFIANNPNSSLSVWLSMIPFTSPIAMMVRLPFGVPDWQLYLSVIILIAGFIFTTWVAARIYRVGILMYGKKTSYKELIKWFFYKG